MRINNNVAAFNAWRNLSSTNTSMGKSLEKLSSGFRINRAADDAAGLVISQNLRAQISGLKQATRNAQDGISVAQTAEGALTEVHSMLNRMRDLAVGAANTGTMDTAAIAANQAEFAELRTQINDIATKTKFGSQALLDGTFTGRVFQVGANNGDTITVGVANMGTGAGALAISTLDLTAAGGPAAAITALDTAITTVSTERGKLGATQNRFESVINNLQVTTENLVSSESRIRDVDMASEMTNFTKNQVLMQAGTSMLGQANSLSQSVLSLLQ
ncbi:MAG: flagellin [Microthrixaceae bacterium]|nr:flagellin [Microthrixaceae bacterium]